MRRHELRRNELHGHAARAHPWGSHVGRVGTTALALGLAVAACGGGSGVDVADATTTTASGAIATTATSEPPPTGPDDATTAPTTAPPTTAPPEPDGACLVGEWFVPELEMNRYYDALAVGVEGLSFNVLGGTRLTFTEDTYEWAPDFVLQLTVAGLGGTGDVSGTITGTYSASDGVVTTSSEVNDLSITVVVAGQTMDGGEVVEAFLADAPINEAPYECDDDTLVLGFETADDRTPVTFTRR